MGREAQAALVWAPQPGPQAALIECPFDEIFYGGARGGGKTDAMLGKFGVKQDIYGKDAVGTFFRKSRTDLREAIERSQDIYGPIGAKWRDQAKEWRFASGARLKFEYVESVKDAANYQGHNYTDLFFEELTNWADPKPIDMLRATLRSPAGVPCQFHATGNPGGPGHSWVRARYIDPAPGGWEPVTETFVDPFTGEEIEKTRVFIPSRLTDNAYLGQSYIATLHQSGSETLVNAWLMGDWSIVDGAFFDCWRSSMQLRPFEIPEHWMRFRSMDWGSAKPFSVGWWAVASDDYIHEGTHIPRGALVRYREWYGCRAGEPDTGLKMTAESVAAGILEREQGESISYGVCDPAMFSEDGGPSIAERMRPLFWQRADNARVARQGHLGGWDQMRARMQNDQIFCFTTCVDSIRTIPVLPHDPNRAEDLDTTSEDHAADEWRYACMSRPYVAPKATGGEQPTDAWGRRKSLQGDWRTM